MRSPCPGLWCSISAPRASKEVMQLSTFSVFEIGKSALIAARRTMDVTGHNIANAATPGYSRQHAMLEPIIQRNSPVSGAGVRAADIVRIRDKFVDAVLRTEYARRQSFEVKQEALDHLQVVLAEPSDSSLRNAVDSFWAAWQDLAASPTSQSARSQVMETGRSLVDLFAHFGSQIDSLSRDIEINIESVVARVNLLCEKVAGLNIEIGRALARREPASDLQDERDLILDELAELAGTNVSQIGDGDQVRVNLGSFPLVDRDITYKLRVLFEPDTVLKWVSGAGEEQTVDFAGGALAGCQEARDDIVRGFRDKLESLFRSIVDDINTIHLEGFPLEGDSSEFFAVSNPNDYLRSVSVHPSIVQSPRTICVSRKGDPLDPLDGSNAYRIADRLKVDGPDSPGFVQAWTAILGEVGAVGQKVGAGLKVGELLVKELQNRKDSISGVSVDEEVANLMREQHAFNAASRLITVADEMIDTIITRMGLAGR